MGRSSLCQREFHVNTARCQSQGQAGAPTEPEAEDGRRSTCTCVRTGERPGYLYRTNSLRMGSSRSNSQQEFKWSWEQMMDEMAEALNMDPVKFRLLNLQKPGTKVGDRAGWSDDHTDAGDGARAAAPTTAMRGRKCLEEGAKAIGWDRRNPGAGRQSWKVQAGIRDGDESAPCGPRGLSGRRRRLRLGRLAKTEAPGGQ